MLMLVKMHEISTENKITKIFTYINLKYVLLTVRFIKLRNFLSISVIIEKSPSGKYSLTVVTLI